MKQVKFKITGRGPIILHSDRGANPLDPLTKELKEITAVRKKKDSHHEAISRLQWQLGLYYNDDIGVYIPGENIEACLLAGAKLQKLGTTFKRGLMVADDKCKLTYKGTTKKDKLFKDYEEFALIRTVVISRARVVATRPLFNDWSAEFTIAFDEDQLNIADVMKAVEDAGSLIGLGGWRPRYGRFSVEVL